MADVTRDLTTAEAGDPHPARRLLPLVNDDLRAPGAARRAQEQASQTLQPTALAHEASPPACRGRQSASPFG